MSAQLSKLHVRFIQTQKNFHLLKDAQTKAEKLPLSQLYVKDNNNFYLINQNSPIQEDQALSILFKEATPALDNLDCKLSVQEIQKHSEEYEDALLFFNTQTQDIKQLLLLSIEEIK